MKTLLALVFWALSSMAGAQTLVQNGNNVYSPHMQFIGSTLYMYFGGWHLQGEQHDKIYRSVCSNASSCTFEQAVVFAENGTWTELPQGMALINDPAIIQVGSQLVMFFTVCPEPNRCGTDSSTNEVWAAFSSATDGLHWTAPIRVLYDAWLPSAVLRPDGNIWLYANNGHDGALFYVNLGTDGHAPSGRIPVYAGYGGYVNVEVRYNPPNATYYMVGERNGVGIIDALYSYDGQTFYMLQSGIAVPTGAYTYIRTPAMHPWFIALYAGATMDNTYGEGNVIFEKPYP